MIFITNQHSTLLIYTAYIPQGHRFNILEDIGCYPALYNTPPAYPLVWIWPTVISLTAACYCRKRVLHFFLHLVDIQLFVSHDHPHPGTETG